MKSILVYCGSSRTSNAVFNEVAEDLGRLLAERSFQLVYGGGGTGLMGVVANSVMAHGGRVTGIIPKAMAGREVAHYGITKLHIVDTIHQRKAMMLDMADAVLALPGGLGTLEEWAEAMTWLNLGYHQKPCGLLNHLGFYDPLVALLKRMQADGFLRDAWMDHVVVENSALVLLDALEKEMSV